MRIGATEGSASGPAPSVRHQGGHSPKVQCEADQRPFSPHLLLAPHLASLGERTVLAAATHIHFGHTGAHPEFAGRAARPSEARYLAESDFEAVLIEPFATTWTFSTWQPGGFDPQSSVIMSAPTARLIEDGSVLGLGVGQLEAIHPPGILRDRSCFGRRRARSCSRAAPSATGQV